MFDISLSAASSARIAFMSASYVAREVGFRLEGGWQVGEAATNQAYQPLATFGARFDALLALIQDLGFTVLDLWTAHLNWAWATPEHVAIARTCLDRRGLRVAGYAGDLGATLADLERASQFAAAISAETLCGAAPWLAHDRAGGAAILRRTGLRLGIENEAGETPDEMASLLHDADRDVIGTTVDTGANTQGGGDAIQAITQLGSAIIAVHLKDIVRVESHETCRYGAGIVPIPACVAALQRVGYQGAITVEHEAERFDPTEDCREMRRQVLGWLTAW